MSIKIHPDVTADLVVEAVQRDDLDGFCIACGAEQRPIEPDGEKGECESCGAQAVYGAEQLLLHMVP